MRALLLWLCLCSTALAQKQFGFDNKKSSGQPYRTPAETVAGMTVPEGFEVKLYAGEPQLVNPVAMTVDERGRVWIVECFEYPKRTAKGKMPRDRIKILEDTDGDGVCDKVTTFIEGKDFPVSFDMASGIEVGNGGVYFGAPPYIFFIENKDDKPGKIEILLKGFGSQDTHETLNTFHWGPDGSLYGLQGVYTYSEVKPAQADGPAVRMNAAWWRYQPNTKKFSIHAEGTSNPWGIDYRESDGQTFLACCVIPHMFHLHPGGTYKRQGGQSFNPNVYGYIPEICDHTFHKESGWAHAGLISLDTPLMPEAYRKSVIFGSIHGCSLKRNTLTPNGSTFVASRADDFLQSADKNVRPINLRWGPNGEIFMIDWHDQNPCHQAGVDSWDYERGRVYRIQAKGLKTKTPENFAALSAAELWKRIDDPNPYVARTVRRLLQELGEKIDATTREAMLKRMRESPSLPVLWATEHVSDVKSLRLGWLAKCAVDPAQTLTPALRGAIARGLADDIVDTKLLELWASREPSAAVRGELASFAVRQSRNVELVRALLARTEDAKDPVIPQLLWLAYEPRSGDADALTWLQKNAARNAILTDTIVPRTLRRLTASGKQNAIQDGLKFIINVNDPVVRKQAMEGMLAALVGRQLDAPPEWIALRTALVKETDPELTKRLDKLAVHFRDAAVMKRALLIAADSTKPVNDRVEALRNLGLAHPADAQQKLIQFAGNDPAAEVRIEAVRALAGYADPTIAIHLLSGWASYSPTLRNELVQLLAGRKEWARSLLQAVAAGKVDRRELTDNVILRMQAFKDPALVAEIEKSWGRLRATPAELNAVIDKMRVMLESGTASFTRGRKVFENQCAKCHKFDGQGHEVGPNIEGAGRDIEYLLANILDPNRVIGAPYFLRTVTLNNGRVETGVLHAEDDRSLTLKTENAVLKAFQKSDIEDVRVQEKSLMPEGLGYNMTPQDFRDLVRYVMAHPFVLDVEIQVDNPPTMPSVKSETPVTGRISLPARKSETPYRLNAVLETPVAMKTKLQFGSNRDAEVIVNGKAFAIKSTPEQALIDIELKPGKNTIAVRSSYRGESEGVYLRVFDPDRKLIWAEGK